MAKNTTKIADLTSTQIVALAKILTDGGSKDTVNGARDALETGAHSFDFHVHVCGEFAKGRDVPDAKPTTSIPFTIVCALLIRRMGITRDDALRYLAEAIPEAIKIGKQGTKARNAVLEQEGVTDAMERFDREVTSKLPPQHKRGSISVKSAEVERVEDLVVRAGAEVLTKAVG